MKRVIILAGLIGCAGVTLTLTAVADWPQFRGPNGQGVSPSKGVPTSAENLAWKAELPGPGGSGPIVFGDRIYVTCYSGYAVSGASGGDLNSLQRHVVCLQRDDGK